MAASLRCLERCAAALGLRRCLAERRAAAVGVILTCRKGHASPFRHPDAVLKNMHNGAFPLFSFFVSAAVWSAGVLDTVRALLLVSGCTADMPGSRNRTGKPCADTRCFLRAAGLWKTPTQPCTRHAYAGPRSASTQK